VVVEPKPSLTADVETGTVVVVEPKPSLTADVETGTLVVEPKPSLTADVETGTMVVEPKPSLTADLETGTVVVEPKPSLTCCRHRCCTRSWGNCLSRRDQWPSRRMCRTPARSRGCLRAAYARTYCSAHRTIGRGESLFGIKITLLAQNHLIHVTRTSKKVSI
jgi:hypothetical protein